MYRRLALFLAACTGLFVSHLQADDVAALPGSNSLGTNVAVFGINPLSSLGNFTSGVSTYLILPLPDGSKSYVIARSGNNSVISVDSNFSNPKTVASFQNSSPCVGATTPPPTCTGAALSPDGSRLVVAAGTVHIFDTSKDQELVSGGLSTQTSVFDVAVSLDGKKAYVLGLTGSSGSQLNVIDLTTNTKEPTFKGINGTATAVTVGPNGLIYVSTQNQIIELDPTTLQPTIGGIIGVNALPGKLVFTPDGKYALTENLTPITGYSLILVDLATRTAFPQAANLNTAFDTLLVANSTTLFAYSSQTQQLYQLGIGSGGSVSVGSPSIGGAPVTFVNGVAISNEVPFAGGPIAHYLFIYSGNILYRVDLTQGQITAQTALTNQQYGALDYIGLPSTNASAALLPYGDKQTLAPNAKSLPLVVRALDTNGKPVIGATINFSANVNTASVSPTSATTGANGFAETILTAPPTNGTVTVVATDGKHPFGFTITVGTATTPTSGTLTIVSGQGQILTENSNTAVEHTGSPLIVKLTDLTGKPVSNASVVFTITSGAQSGSLFGGTSLGANTVKVNTDATGVASANFGTAPVQLGFGFTQTTVTATVAGTTPVTFYVTTVPNNPACFPAPEYQSPQSGDKLGGPAGTTETKAFSAIIAAPCGGGPSGSNAIPNVSIRACQPQLQTTPATCTVPAADAAVPFGTCDSSGVAALSDAHGVLTCDLILNGVVGTNTIGVQIGFSSVSKSFPLTITAGPPGTITPLQGNNQTGKPGQQLTQALVVQVTDAFGNVLPFTPINFSVLDTGAPATLQSASTATDGNGKASTLVTLGNTAGTVNIKVTAGDASNTFNLTVSNPAAGIKPISGDLQSTLVGTAFTAPLVVEVLDGQGNAVSGAPVTFTVTSNNAVVGTPNALADTTGQASTTVTAGAAAGNIVVVAASGSFSTTFTLSAHLAGPQNILFLNGASFHLQNGCAPPGCVAPGEVVTIQGSGFATGVQGVVSGLNILGPLQTSLAGVSITFNGVAAPIFYVANINGVESMTVQVPFETPLGSTAVVLNAAGGGSANFTVQTQPYAPGVFTSTYGNVQIAVAVRSDGSYVSPTNPAHRGETIYVFATGLGQTTPPATTNQPGDGQLVTAGVLTGLNNKGVPHTIVQYAPGLVGVYTVAVQVPLNTDPGPHQPFGLILNDAAGNLYYAQSTSIPIQ